MKFINAVFISLELRIFSKQKTHSCEVGLRNILDTTTFLQSIFFN